MRNAPDTVMLFAAGFGTRMKALTKDRPKPLIEVAGKPLIGHALDLVADAGPLRTVANLHYKPQMLTDYLSPRGVKVVVETPEILDTGGGLRNALPLLGESPVFTLNTDAIWSGPNPLRLLGDAWAPAEMDALLVCIPLAQAVACTSSGDFAIGPDGRLARRGPWVYGGAQIVKTDRLAEISGDRFSLNLLWDLMLADGRLHGLSYPGKWCDVGHPEGIAAGAALLGAPDV
jgi:MurNAc alpha-1-phosphate uridylyltransferase